MVMSEEDSGNPVSFDSYFLGCIYIPAMICYKTTTVSNIIGLILIVNVFEI
jgi:hypothetical protein